MDLLLLHTQDKTDKKSGSTSTCDLKLYSNENNIEYVGTFNFDYQRYGSKKQITFIHSFNLNILTGDIIVGYQLFNNNLTNEKQFKSSSNSFANM